MRLFAIKKYIQLSHPYGDQAVGWMKGESYFDSRQREQTLLLGVQSDVGHTQPHMQIISRVKRPGLRSSS
jgi:hypothetical protein